MNLTNLMQSFPLPVSGGTLKELNKEVNIGSPFIWIELPLSNSLAIGTQLVESMPIRIRCLETCEASIIDNFAKTLPISQRCKQILDAWIFKHKKEFDITSASGNDVLYVFDRNYVGWFYTLTFRSISRECCD